MRSPSDVHDLRGVLDRLMGAGSEDRVSITDILDALGQRSFAPLLLVPAVLLVSPLSGIPGAGTFGAVIIALVSAQLMAGRSSLWLPGFIQRRTVERRKLTRAIDFLRPIAAFIDRLIGPRFGFLTRGVFSRLVGMLCLMIALVMPPLEFVPMANSLAAAVVAVLALALVAHDGALVVLALLIAAAGGYLGAGFVAAL